MLEQAEIAGLPRPVVSQTISLHNTSSSQPTHTPTTADDDQTGLVLHASLGLILLVIEVDLDYGQIVLSPLSRVQTQWVDRDPIRVSLSVGSRIVDEDCAEQHANTQDRGQHQSKSQRGIGVVDAKLLGCGSEGRVSDLDSARVRDCGLTGEPGG